MATGVWVGLRRCGFGRLEGRVWWWSCGWFDGCAGTVERAVVADGVCSWLFADATGLPLASSLGASHCCLYTSWYFDLWPKAYLIVA